MNKTEALLYFANWIEKETGIIYEEHNYYQLQDRLEQISRHFNLTSIDELYRKAQVDMVPEFSRLLIDISTNNETSFFRDLKFFECLESHIIPILIKQCGSLSDIKIWSVASSSGQEPYSLSMLMYEAGQRLNQVPSSILATDISEKILNRAREGKYSDIEVGRGLLEERRSKYITSDLNNCWILDKKIKNLVEFKHLNLTTNFNLGRKFDLILCRNVLIYQRVKAKSEIINRISQHLNPNGIFLMGSGESLIGLSADFQQELINGVAIYRKKENIEKLAV
jgi:chemotaxis protein methyltransferase CheR